jgi:hypothetical protein
MKIEFSFEGKHVRATLSDVTPHDTQEVINTLVKLRQVDVFMDGQHGAQPAQVPSPAVDSASGNGTAKDLVVTAAPPQPSAPAQPSSAPRPAPRRAPSREMSDAYEGASAAAAVLEAAPTPAQPSQRVTANDIPDAVLVMLTFRNVLIYCRDELHLDTRAKLYEWCAARQHVIPALASEPDLRKRVDTVSKLIGVDA